MTHDSSSGKHSLPPPRRTLAAILRLMFAYMEIGLTIIQGIVLVPLYISMVGVELYGGWLAIGSILSYLMLTDIGASSLLYQRIAKAYGEEDSHKMSQILGSGFGISLICAAILVFIGLCIQTYITTWIGLSGTSAEVLAKGFGVAVWASALTLVSTSLVAPLHALQRVTAVGICSLLATILGILSTILMLFNEFGIMAIPYGFLIRGIIMVVGEGIVLSWVWNRIVRVVPSFSVKEMKKLLNLSLYLILGKIGGTLFKQSQPLVLSMTLGVVAVPIYVLTARSSQIFQMLTERISSTIGPGLSHLHGGGDLLKLKSVLFHLLRNLALFLSLGAGFIFAFNEPFMNLWVGHDLYGGISLTGLIIVATISTVITQSISSILFSLGYIRSIALVSLGESIVGIPLMFLLISLYGIKGIPLAMLGSAVLVSLPYFVYLIIKSRFLSGKQCFGLLSVFAITLAFSLTLAAIWRNFPIESWFGICSHGIAFSLSAITIAGLISQQIRQDLLYATKLVKLAIPQRRT